MRVFLALAGSALLLVFVNGCGKVLDERGSAEASSEIATPDLDGGVTDSSLLPDVEAESFLPDVTSDGGLVDGALDSTVPDVSKDDGPVDGSTYCPVCGAYDCGAGFWCPPDEKCTSIGSQPSGPQTCCPRHPKKDAALPGLCPR